MNTMPSREIDWGMENLYPKMGRSNNRCNQEEYDVGGSLWHKSLQPTVPSTGRVKLAHADRSAKAPSPRISAPSTREDTSNRPPSVEEYGPNNWMRPWESTVATPEPVKQLISKYRTTKRVGGGAFGDIYICVNDKGEKVAVKFEQQGVRSPQLRHEYKVLRELQNAPGFAKLYHYGTQDGHAMLVMDLLGPSLEDQFNKCARTFSLKTVCMIADQMLTRIEFMHSRHLLHRDIKPANFVTDRTKGKLIYCIDFGLSKIYRHPKTLQHIPKGKALMAGTPRYASINSQLGRQQSRRDDLESIAHVLIYFMKGRLPWQGLGGEGKDKYRRIVACKQNTPIEELCQGLPDEFGEFLRCSRSLKFEEEPNYQYIRGLFRELFLGIGNTIADYDRLDWDWNRVEEV